MKNKKDQSLAASVPAGSESALRDSSKHTPGPWTMRRDGVILAESRTERQAIGQFFGMASDQQHVDEHSGNCRLIAAAPELLEATKRAYQALSNILEFRIIHDPDKREAIRDIVAQLSRALVKAKGTTADERTSSPNPASGPNSNADELYEKGLKVLKGEPA